MESKTKPSLLSLPTELLEKIFSFLKTQDIRMIRRVNKQLNDFYCDNDIFRCNQLNYPRPLLKLLNRSKRFLFNLHFHCVKFEDNSLMSFFQKRGSKVQSLSFYDCNFPCRLLQNIILQCTALRSFSYISSKDFHRSNKLDDFCEFETRSIVREEVTSLTFVMGRLFRKDMDEIELTLRRFMSIFPNVTRLDIRIPNSLRSHKKSKHDYPNYDPDSDNDSGTCEICATKNIMRSAAIYDSICHVSKNLKWLRTDLSSPFLTGIGQSFFEALPNLIYLSWDLEEFRVGEVDVRKWRTPLRRFPWYEMGRLYTNPIANVVQQLNPKHFGINKRTYGTPKMDSNLFRELLGSEVQTLEFTHRNDWTADPIHLLHSPNTTLTDLTILADYFPSNFTAVALFPEHFRALVHLKLGVVSNEILQLIFKNQKNLQSLSLKNCRGCNLYGFTGAENERQLSIRELRNLEHLTIKGFKVSMLESTRFIDAFHFPSLKYLNIETDIDYSSLKSKTRMPLSQRIPIALFESMKNLEALRLSNLGRASFRELKALCKTLKNLRYLEYNCPGIYRHINRVCIVDLSESTFKDLNLKDDLSYYDKFMKKIVLTDEWAYGTLFSPKISSFVIDWIEF